jgi:hypothetical protein
MKTYRIAVLAAAVMLAAVPARTQSAGELGLTINSYLTTGGRIMPDGTIAAIANTITTGTATRSMITGR